MFLARVKHLSCLQGRLRLKTEAALKDQDSPSSSPAAAGDWTTETTENETDQSRREEGSETPGLTDNNESSLII